MAFTFKEFKRVVTKHLNEVKTSLKIGQLVTLLQQKKVISLEEKGHIFSKKADEEQAVILFEEVLFLKKSKLMKAIKYLKMIQPIIVSFLENEIRVDRVKVKCPQEGSVICEDQGENMHMELSYVDISTERNSLNSLTGYITYYTGIKTSEVKQCRYLSFYLQTKNQNLTKVVAIERYGSEEYLDDTHAMIGTCLLTGAIITGFSNGDRGIVYINRLVNIRKYTLMFNRVTPVFAVSTIINSPDLVAGSRVDTVFQVIWMEKVTRVLCTNGCQVAKQVLLVADNNNIIKLALYGGSATTLKVQKTYYATNLLLKGNSTIGKYIESKTTQSDFVEYSLEINVPNIDEIKAREILKQGLISGNITRVSKVKIYRRCIICRYELVISDNNEEGTCPHCGDAYLLKSAECSIVAQIVISDDEGDECEEFRFPFFETNIKSIIHASNYQNFDVHKLENLRKLQDGEKEVLFREVRKLLLRCPRLSMTTKKTKRGENIIGDISVDDIF